MRYPAFVAEMGRESNRPKLWAGVWSGYSIAAGFALLALGAALFDVTPYGEEFAVMLAFKIITNTLVLIALHSRWPAALELMGVNMVADQILMTAAIYYTGGPVSPLVAIYVIEVTVVALLSNVGITLIVASGATLCYGIMCTLVATGTLPPTLPPGLGAVDATAVGVFLAFAAFTIGVPTLLTLKILALLKQKEQSLEARTAELIEAGKQRSVFMASLTHELRTPIHGVQGLADLISTGVYGPTNDKQREAAASIKRSAQSLLHLVDDLLAMVRAEVGRLEVKLAPVELRELVEQVVASVQWMLGTKQLTLQSEIGPHGDGEVISDRRLLGQILVNLVANAAKFTPQGGRVTVRARVEGDRLILQVSDTGIGIPADKRAAIFEAFRQLDASDERTYGGVGLGLALVRRLCELLGGTVSVDSVVDQGSTFTVSVPASASSASASASPSRSASPPEEA